MPPAPRPRLDVQHLYRTYSGLVRARARRFFSDEEAEDVVQAVFVRVVERQDSFRGESSPVTWLYQVTTRHCINRKRDQGRRLALLEQHQIPWWSSARSAADQEALLMLQERWRTLDEESALIAVYYHLDGMDRDQIAALVGYSPRTVSYRLEKLKALATEGP